MHAQNPVEQAARLFRTHSEPLPRSLVRGQQASRLLLRPGFTLVEMMVAVSIIVILAGFAVLFVPRASEQQRAARAATLLQNWLSIARQRAKRDRVPTGLRLLINTDLPMGNLVTQCQFIQRPDDFNGGTISTVGAGPPFTSVQIKVNTTNNAGEFYGSPSNFADATLWEVQPGDYLEVMFSGQVHAIRNSGVPTNDIAYDAATRSYTVALASGIPFAVNQSWQYRVIRGARVTPEDPLDLTGGIVIDLNTNIGTTTPPIAGARQVPVTITNGYCEILFAPSGEVFGAGISNDYIPFWVRDSNTDNLLDGEPTIIAVNVRTGAIAAHSPFMDDAKSPPGTLNDPYKFVNDGRSQ